MQPHVYLSAGRYRESVFRLQDCLRSTYSFRRKLILLLTLAPFVALVTQGGGQTTPSKSLQGHSSAAGSLATEECEYGKSDQQQRPGLPSAATAIDDSSSNAEPFASPSSSAQATEDLRLPGVKAHDPADGAQELQCKKDESKDKTSAPSKAPSTTSTPGIAAVAPPPLVTYSNGTLTINAHNVLFSDVLEAIRARTGAVVEFPPSLGKNRVFDTIGPAPMREVLTAFLEGSDFNYVMLSSPSDPRIVHRIILTARQVGSSVAATAQNPVQTSATGAGLGGAGFAKDTEQAFEEEPAPAAPAMKAVVPSLGGKSLQEQAAALQQANPQMTRGEILGELQRRHSEELDQQAPEGPDPPQ